MVAKPRSSSSAVTACPRLTRRWPTSRCEHAPRYADSARLAQRLRRLRQVRKNSNVQPLRVTVTLAGRAWPAGPKPRAARARALSVARHTPAPLPSQLADEQGKVVVRGFRQMPGGAPNPGQSAGVQFGDLLDAVQGERLGSFQEAVGRLKGLSGTVTLTLIRER